MILMFSYRYGDAAIDEYINIPDIATMGTQYSAPSTRANSESNLRSVPLLMCQFLSHIPDIIGN